METKLGPLITDPIIQFLIRVALFTHFVFKGWNRYAGFAGYGRDYFTVNLGYDCPVFRCGLKDEGVKPVTFLNCLHK
jgi:hypothetical protein